MCTHNSQHSSMSSERAGSVYRQAVHFASIVLKLLVSVVWFFSLLLTTIFIVTLSPSSAGVHLGRGLRGDWLSGGGVPRLPERTWSGTRRLRHPYGGVHPTWREPALGPGSGLHRYRRQPDLPGPRKHGRDRCSDSSVQGQDGLQHWVPAPPGRVHEAVLPGGRRPSPVLHRESLPRRLQAFTLSSPTACTCFQLNTI